MNVLVMVHDDARRAEVLQVVRQSRLFTGDGIVATAEFAAPEVKDCSLAIISVDISSLEQRDWSERAIESVRGMKTVVMLESKIDKAMIEKLSNITCRETIPLLTQPLTWRTRLKEKMERLITIPPQLHVA